VGPTNHVSDGGPDPPMGRAILEIGTFGRELCKTAEPMDLPFGLWTRVH